MGKPAPPPNRRELQPGELTGTDGSAVGLAQVAHRAEQAGAGALLVKADLSS